MRSMVEGACEERRCRRPTRLRMSNMRVTMRGRASSGRGSRSLSPLCLSHGSRLCRWCSCCGRAFCRLKRQALRRDSHGRITKPPTPARTRPGCSPTHCNSRLAARRSPSASAHSSHGSMSAPTRHSRRCSSRSSLIPLIIPGILFTVSWIFLGSPKIGIINLVLQHAFDTDAVFINVYSMPGMIWVDGLHYSPMAFLLMTAAFRAMDPSLEESALMSGATVPQIARRVTLKLAWPATVAALLILFVRALESFEVPALLGLPVGIEVYTSAIYDAIHKYPSEVGLASAYAVTLLIITSICIYLQSRVVRGGGRYATVTGKGYPPARHEHRPLALPHRGDLHFLFHHRGRAAVPGPGVVVAAALLQRAVFCRGQESLVRFLSHGARVSADRHGDLEQPPALARQRDADHAGDVGFVLDRGADKTSRTAG